ncbi:Nuclear transport factor 2 family protein with RNA binding domain, RRM-RBD-RNP motifs [Prunus dulcis]|uniref:Nuclear transport factor 2 family protein with RNA binding domain, RRM-RBD-RNP motifs n=1 Tax=Prunus dulcis TaxID=3755 RepID=A0A4Y1S1K0_PRUDU|nr:Nuclear transport factor 2 family protein with RNA binding domain, RRM-RBD-RNP motifs [Prunus dulcis]
MTIPVQQAPASNLPPSADVVGNAFVLQYYNILEQSPQLVHRFYQDISKLGRPGDDGIMSITTTMDAINKKILDYGELSANIVTVDAQESYNGEYVDDSTPQNGDNGLVVDAAVEAPLTPKHDTTALQGYHVSEPVVVVSEDVAKEEVYNPTENGEVSIEEEEAPVPEVVNEIPDDSQVVAESYSIVEAKSNSKVEAESNSKVEAESNSKLKLNLTLKLKSRRSHMPQSTVPFSTPAPASVRSVPKKQEQQVTAAPTSVPVSETVVSSTNARENGNLEAEAEGHSIYIKGLPMNSTNALIENEFKKFGLIKQNGVQVRSLKGFCFGFVEYEAASSVHSAMEASPIMIGNRQIFVEEKRSTRGNNRGRFSSGRGNGNGYRAEGGNGYRTEGARGRGGYGGGRAYGRGDSGFKSEFGSRSSNRGGAPSRGADGYQRSDHGGRVNRPAGVAVNTAAKSTAPQVSASA